MGTVWDDVYILPGQPKKPCLRDDQWVSVSLPMEAFLAFFKPFFLNGAVVKSLAFSQVGPSENPGPASCELSRQ